MKKIIIILIIVVIIFISGLYYFNINKLNDVKNIYINDNNKIVLELISSDETSCYIGNNLNNVKWVKSNNTTCILDYKEDKFIYLKNKYNKINKITNKKLVKLLDLEIENKEVYLAIGGSEKIEYSYKTLGSTHEKIKFTSIDQSVATVDNDGVIIGKSNGETFVKVSYLDKEEKVKVVVTNKIVTHKEEFDYNKKYLECGIYTKEDNDLLDKILENRINNAGYKTRAGVVAAARFIAL